MEMHQPSKLKNIGSNPIGVTKYDVTGLYLLNVGTGRKYGVSDNAIRKWIK